MLEEAFFLANISNLNILWAEYQIMRLCFLELGNLSVSSMSEEFNGRDISFFSNN